MDMHTYCRLLKEHKEKGAISILKSKSNYLKVFFYSFLVLVSILAVIPDTDELPEIAKISDKLNHFVALFISALLLDLAYSDKGLLRKFSFLALYGLLIEIIQYFLPYREFSLGDLAADISGLLIYFSLSKVRKLLFVS